MQAIIKFLLDLLKAFGAAEYQQEVEAEVKKQVKEQEEYVEELEEDITVMSTGDLDDANDELLSRYRNNKDS